VGFAPTSARHLRWSFRNGSPPQGKLGGFAEVQGLAPAP
jgi:hypothetical protein